MTADHGATARAVATAVLAVPGVARLTSGRGAVAAATHYPGGTVRGVRLSTDRVRVHIVVAQLPLRPVADEALRAARTVLDGMGDARKVEVVIDDVDESALDWLGAASGGPP